MRFIITVYLMVSGFLLSAQEASISSEAYWTYTPSSDIDPSTNEDNLGYIFRVRDSTIDGQEVYILQANIMNGVNTHDRETIIWYDQQKMYFREDEQWKLFCDFSLEVGDTMSYQIPRNQNAFDIHCGEEAGPNYQAKAIVDSVSKDLIGDEFFKQLHFRTLFGPDLAIWELGVMTELLSSEYGYFGRSAKPCAIAYSGSLRCFQDKYCEEGEGFTLGYQVGDLPCFHLRIDDGCGPNDFGLAELATIEGGIYINPTNASEMPIKVHIYDLSGRTVFEGLITEKRQLIIPTSAWTSNIYVVRLLGSTQFLSKKLWFNQ
ncbi:MAG: hypothetical protein AB8H47_22985 [Bacteroidia bacterium]